MEYRRISRGPRTSARRKESAEERYTIPRKKYDYKKVSWDEYMSNTYDGLVTIRSSFIPYSVKNGKTYWLLGSFHDYPRDILADFGGSCIIYDPPMQYLRKGENQIKNYQHQFGCAMLEVFEESKGFLTQPILKSLGENDKNKFIIYKGENRRDREKIYFFFVPLNYNEIDNMLNTINTTRSSTKERFGPIDFYLESEMYSRKYRTSRNLTDFLDWLTGKEWVFTR